MITEDPLVFMETVKDAIRYYDERKVHLQDVFDTFMEGTEGEGSAAESDATMYGGMGGLTKKES